MNTEEVNVCRLVVVLSWVEKTILAPRSQIDVKFVIECHAPRGQKDTKRREEKKNRRGGRGACVWDAARHAPGFHSWFAIRTVVYSTAPLASATTARRERGEKKGGERVPVSAKGRFLGTNCYKKTTLKKGTHNVVATLPILVGVLPHVGTKMATSAKNATVATRPRDGIMPTRGSCIVARARALERPSVLLCIC